MTSLLTGYRGLLRAVGRLEAAIAMALLAAIVLAIAAQVFSRYILGRPLVWVEELATYCFIWTAFLGASIGMKQWRHVKVEMLSLKGGRQTRSALKLLACVAMAIALGMLAWQATGVMRIESASRSISLPLDVSRMWFYSVPLFVASLSMLATLLYVVLAELHACVTGLEAQPVEADSSGLREDAA
ncbi:TRAP transporter small permease [Bordetella sp. 2513F-2]